MARTSTLRRELDFSTERSATSSHERPVDLVHLSHQTMGDAGLEREVLGLLARQIASFEGRLDSAAFAERTRVAHTLRGAALNIGAFRLARMAEALEHAPASSEALLGLEHEMAIAASFIADLLRGSVTSR